MRSYIELVLKIADAIELVLEIADARAQRDMLLAAAEALSKAYGPDASNDDIGGQRTRAWNDLREAIAACEGEEK